jgi:hypothetical protein
MAPAKKPPKTGTAKAAPPAKEPPKIYRSLGQIRRAFYPGGAARQDTGTAGKQSQAAGFPGMDSSVEERGRLQA